MIKVYPQDELVSRYVEYYWLLGNNETDKVQLGQIYDFPCLSNELIIDFEGSGTFFYKSKLHKLKPCTLFSYMDACISVDLSQITSFTVVRFKTMGPAASLPFLKCSAPDLIRTQFINANDVFSRPIDRKLLKVLRNGSTAEKRNQLDQWLSRSFSDNRVSLLNQLSKEIKPHHDVAEIANMSNLSLSSLERYFKRETGLTPKKFLLHNRFRLVLQDIAGAGETDWHDIIARYNYYDQAHLIKEIKRFSGLTPTQLLQANKLSTLRVAS